MKVAALALAPPSPCPTPVLRRPLLAFSPPQDMGNKALQTGLEHKKKFYLRQAIEQYSQGLALMCSDADLNSVLYANRAHVNLLLGNFRNALHDAKYSARANPSNVKVLRGAQRGRWAQGPGCQGTPFSSGCWKEEGGMGAAGRDSPIRLPAIGQPSPTAILSTLVGALSGGQGGSGAAQVRHLRGALPEGAGAGPCQ